MSAGIVVETFAAGAGGQSRGVLSAALRLRRTRLGLALLLAVTAVAVVGPLVAAYGPTELVGPPNAASGSGRPLGTDHLGHDVLSRFLFGGREVLALAVVATALGMILGVSVGLVAAYVRGVVDQVLMAAMDVVLSFPQIVLALVAIATVGPRSSVIVLSVAGTTMPRVARIARAAALPVVQQDFVAAAEAISETRARILVAEILPNIATPLTVEAALRLAYSVGLISALAFLGLTADVTNANWGVMIHENRIALMVQPWGVVAPALALALLTLGAGLVGDGIARSSIRLDRISDDR